ncbi:MAG: FtsX-like permease family protein, partial [Chloroflexi bacterium]|nr:FtsX-like permease family protein [Chloroflexota bacterium]
GWPGGRGKFNDVVLTGERGTDLAAVKTALVAEAAEPHADTGLDLMRTEDDASYLALTRDPEGDQQFYNVFAVILFAGAAFASLNFAARMVETQRREIGTSMALGENPVAIAVRPLLVGVQIALLGVVFGIGMGLLIAMLMQGVLESFVPLPVFITPFQTGIFAGVAAVGFLLPILAVLWPVFRAVRVQPVDAIRTGHLAARGGGLAPAISRLPLPGSSLRRMPFRNLMRAPRRTVLTLFALTAVLAILVSVVGMTDSLLATLAGGDEELLRGVPDRLIVRLDSFYPVDSPEVNGIISGGSLGVAEPGIVLGGSVQGADESVTVAVQYADLEGGAWKPTVLEGTLSSGRPGIVLARKAAEDLGVGAGDSVTLTLPVRTGPDSFTLGESAVPVLAVHPHPLRFNAYMDIRHAGQAGLEGFANVVTGAPASGKTLNDVKRALFGSPGVATVEGIAETSQAAQEVFEQFASIFIMMQVFVLGLALLIAFNTANINSDERQRDHATMFAYGIPVRRVIGILAMEGLVLGILASILGIVLGYALLLWIIIVLVPASYPDMGVILTINIPALAGFLGAGIVVVALAPALTVRKLQRMNVPSTLRVLE